MRLQRADREAERGEAEGVEFASCCGAARRQEGQTPKSANAPIGTLMKNTQRQL